MRDGYDARDADGDRWRDDMGWQREQRPPVNGAQRSMPPTPPTPPTRRTPTTPPAPPMAPASSHRRTPTTPPAAPMPQSPAMPPADAWGTAWMDPANPTRGFDDADGRRVDRPAHAMTGHDGDPPASPLRRATRADPYDDARTPSPRRLDWSSAPPPPPLSMPSRDRTALPETPEPTAHDADEQGVADGAPRSHTIDSAAPARSAKRSGRRRSARRGGRLRALVEYVATAVRRSVPVRTLLFVLPPLVLPTLAFDLSLGATIAAALLLLWLVAATAALTMIMLEGSRHVAVRALGDRLAQLSDGEHARGGESTPNSAGVAPETHIAGAGGGEHDRRGRPAEVDAAVPSHWPQQTGDTSRPGEQDDRYGRSAAPNPDWGESRWRQ